MTHRIVMLGMRKYAGRRSRLEYRDLRDKHRETVSKTMRERVVSDETKARMSAAQRDPEVKKRVHTPEANRKKGLWAKGKPKSALTRQRMRASWEVPSVRASRTSWLSTQVQSAETRAKRSATMKRLGGPSPETILKMRKPKSEAGRLNMRLASQARARRRGEECHAE